MAKATICVLYWLRDERFEFACPFHHGYIGVSSRWPQRLHRHKSGKHFCAKNVCWQILYEGTEQGCLALEKKLRPRPYIGWNIAAGGGHLEGHLKGIPKSLEWRAQMSITALERYCDPAEKEKTSKAVRRGLKDIDRSGANNHRFGTHMSEATKQKMRDKVIERGGVTGANNPMFGRRRPDLAERNRRR